MGIVCRIGYSCNFRYRNGKCVYMVLATIKYLCNAMKHLEDYIRSYAVPQLNLYRFEINHGYKM